MTTKKQADKNEKHLNQTAHQRAMTKPEVREALKVLRTSWSGLSPEQRGEKLNVLIGFECSRRGIAEELGEPESKIRRYVALANPPEEGSDRTTMITSTLAKKPEEQISKIAGEEIRRIPSKIPAGKIVGPVIKEMYPMQDHAHTSTPQQTKKITSPSSTAVTEPPVSSGALGAQENQAGENTPRINLVDSTSNAERIFRDKIEQLISIHNQFKQRPLYDANALERQGAPCPPKDRH